MAIKNKNKKATISLFNDVKKGVLTGAYSKDFNNLKKRINNSLIIDFNNYHFYTTTLRSEVNFYCKLNNVKNKSFKEIFEEKLKLFGFEQTIINRKIETLSTTEKNKFYMLLNLCFKFDMVILVNIFKNLDKKNYNIFIQQINELKEKKKKILLFEDINILYRICDQMIIFKGNEILKCGSVPDILNDVEFLIDNDIQPPYLSKLTYLAKEKKGVKLFYQNDVRDVIKDVYKHVK